MEQEGKHARGGGGASLREHRTLHTAKRYRGKTAHTVTDQR